MAQSGTDEQNVNEAKNVFGMICDFFEKNGFNYDKDEENLTARCVLQGKYIDIYFSFHVEEDEKYVLLLSQLPFEVYEDKRLDIAMAVNEVNFHLDAGSFDYDVNSGRIMFRVTNTYLTTPVSEETISDMFFMTYSTVEKYNDRIFKVSNGLTTIDEFIDSLKEGD